MRRLEIHPIGHNKFRATLYINDKYEDDWIIEECLIHTV
jgi:hypothetical protein